MLVKSTAAISNSHFDFSKWFHICVAFQPNGYLRRINMVIFWQCNLDLTILPIYKDSKIPSWEQFGDIAGRSVMEWKLPASCDLASSSTYIQGCNRVSLNLSHLHYANFWFLYRNMLIVSVLSKGTTLVFSSYCYAFHAKENAFSLVLLVIISFDVNMTYILHIPDT